VIHSIARKISVERKSDNPVRRRGFLIFIVVSAAFVTLLAVGVLYLQERQRLFLEREEARWRQEAFDRVKSGEHRVTIMDPILLSMLADDAECVANLEELCFSMTKITPEESRYVSKLANVTSLFFYDTEGADFVLENARSLPIKNMGFEMARLSNDSLLALSDFPALSNVRFEHVMYADEIALLKTLPARITVHIPYPAENEPGFNQHAHRSQD
jgi:hypothetical protein